MSALWALISSIPQQQLQHSAKGPTVDVILLTDASTIDGRSWICTGVEV
jgi:hypothetical protein